jgi:hypothetical protein
MAITASATLYGMGFLLFGVATGMRYYVWTITGAALGSALIISEILAGGVKVRPWALRASLVVVAVPTSLAIAARLLT